MSSHLSAGKLPAALLSQLLDRLPTTDPALLLGPAVGEDAAVIDLCTRAGGTARPDDMLLVAKSDPITFATDEIGYYAVNVCANDLAVTGATPRFYLPTLLLPVATATTDTAIRIFDQLGNACRRLNIVVAGGHTEVTHAVGQPVLAGTMLGEVQRSQWVSSSGCKPGDILLLAGEVPVEGVSIIAREMRSELLARGWVLRDLERAAQSLHKPGISVLKPAHIAARSGWATAMHDPTEGGLINGIFELALAAGVGLQVDLDAVPLLPGAVELCAVFGLDPLGVIASGALVVTTAPQHADALLQRWREKGCSGTKIGRILPQENGLIAIQKGQRVDFPHFENDEITKLFA